MIRHIVFFKFKPGASENKKNKLASDLKSLKGKIPLINRLEIGVDIGKKQNSYDLALIVDFNTWQDVESYGAHPAHIEVVKLIKDICQNHSKVDYEIHVS